MIYFGSQFEGTTQNSRQDLQEHEAAGPTASTFKKQKEILVASQFTFCFSLSLGPQPVGW